MGISYSAIVLDEISKQNMLSLLSDYIPLGWTIFAHHMTITMGPLVHPKESKRKKGHDYSIFGDPGTPHNLVVSELGLDDRVMAVKVVSPFLTRNDKKGGFAHITIAVNTEAGGKPFHSNKISQENFKTIAELNLPNIIVKGTVQEVSNL
jgi:hypothetical protein